MQTCPTCNAVNNADSKFCFTCGNPLVSTPVQPQQSNQAVQPAQQVQPQQPSQAAQPVQPVQQAQPQQPIQSISPQQAVPAQQPAPVQPPYSPMQAQIPNSLYPSGPSSPSMPYPQNTVAVPGSNLPPYITPPKKSNSVWVIIGSGIVAIAALLYVLVQFTSLGSTVMGWLGLDKSQQVIDYYNNEYLPTFLEEIEIEEDIRLVLLDNQQPDLNLVYQRAPAWKSSFDMVKRNYSNAKVANNDIKEVNELAVQRAIKMEYAIGRLITAIEQDNAEIYHNDFIPSVSEYYRLFEQWQTKLNALFEKHGISFN